MQIFSLLMHLFMGYIVSSLHLLKERICFLMCILNLVFKFGLCIFSQIFLKPMLFIGGVVALHRGNCLYFL